MNPGTLAPVITKTSATMVDAAKVRLLSLYLLLLGYFFLTVSLWSRGNLSLEGKHIEELVGC